MNIADFDYDLPDERIAKFPLAERDASKLLVWRGGAISETIFKDMTSFLPKGSLLVFNNTRVVRARLAMFKSTGGRVEVLCLEPTSPADYERAFAAKNHCEWNCMVGGAKKWKSGPIECGELRALRLEANIVRFEWPSDLTFGELLEQLGRMPIPPYLNRDSEQIDNTRYQTVYARYEGSVAAPTAGLHFTPELLQKLKNSSKNIDTDEVTLHVGAGTFLPVKADNALEHPMHTEHFEIGLATIEHLRAKFGKIIAVGTTSVRTLESLVALAWRIEKTGSPEVETPVGQFESYDIPPEFSGAEALEIVADYMRANDLKKIAASTQIMITPGFEFRIVRGIVTNFHQPKSTLLLLISAFVGDDNWRKIYRHALSHDFRFLSYGDSSLLLRYKK